MLGILTALGATLTLPGIAGIVLTMGMAVDANVLIYERMREEQRAGRRRHRSARHRLPQGASATIIDAHLTALIAAIALFELGHRAGPRLRRDAGHRHRLDAVHRLPGDAPDRLDLGPLRAPEDGAAVKFPIRLVPDDTNLPFMKWARIRTPISLFLIVLSFALFFTIGRQRRASTSRAARSSRSQHAKGAADVGHDPRDRRRPRPRRRPDPEHRSTARTTC